LPKFSDFCGCAIAATIIHSCADDAKVGHGLDSVAFIPNNCRRAVMRIDVCKHCISVEPEAVTDLSRGFLTREAAPGVFMLTNGNYQSLFMTTGEGVVLIDAPEPLVQYIGPAVSDVTDEPIRTLIYSHGHSDHIGGAHLLARPGLEIIAEERVAKFVTDKHDGRRLPPTRTFTDETTLRIGSRTISLKRDEFHPPEGDLIIYLPNEKVMMAVDMIAPGWVPLLDFDITGNMFAYLGAFDRVLAYDFNVFISGQNGSLASANSYSMPPIAIVSFLACNFADAPSGKTSTGISWTRCFAGMQIRLSSFCWIISGER
jgi:glyoxylase-like metal-dependent hydrolase (beta-lactamase superfamily II)